MIEPFRVQWRILPVVRIIIIHHMHHGATANSQEYILPLRFDQYNFAWCPFLYTKSQEEETRTHPHPKSHLQ